MRVKDIVDKIQLQTVEYNGRIQELNSLLETITDRELNIKISQRQQYLKETYDNLKLKQMLLNTMSSMPAEDTVELIIRLGKKASETSPSNYSAEDIIGGVLFDIQDDRKEEEVPHGHRRRKSRGYSSPSRRKAVTRTVEEDYDNDYEDDDDEWVEEVEGSPTLVTTSVDEEDDFFNE